MERSRKKQETRYKAQIPNNPQIINPKDSRHRLLGIVSFLYLVSWLLVIFPAFAQTLRTSEPGKAASESYTLSLDDVTRLALQNNFDIQMARYDARIAMTRQGEAESIYDTIFEAEVKYLDNQKARTTTILGTKNLENDYNLSLSKK